MYQSQHTALPLARGKLAWHGIIPPQQLTCRPSRCSARPAASRGRPGGRGGAAAIVLVQLHPLMVRPRVASQTHGMWWGVPCHSFPRATASAGAAQRSAAAHPGQRAHIAGDAAELLGHDLQPTVGGRSMRREGRHGGLWACCARGPTGTALTQERIHLHGTAKNGTSQELMQ